MIDTNEIRSRANMYEWTDEEVLSLCDEIDRLRAPKQQPQGKGETVRVHIQVGVDQYGRIEVGDKNFQLLNGSYKIYTLTATLPVPADVEVVAKVEGE